MFDGHFPGQPILPGVAVLALVAEALEPPDGARAIRSVRSARFRERVLPGMRLDLSHARGDDGFVRFDVRDGGRRVADGAIAFGAPQGVVEAGFALASRAGSEIPPLDALIPHRPPMRLVRSVLGVAEDGATCLARVPHQLVAGTSASALFALESAAQSAAVWQALRRPAGEGPRVGYLVSLHDVTFHCGTVPVDVDQLATVRLEAAAPPLTHYAVEVIAEGAVVLRGTIGTYLSG
jgi:3-hydroxymyristoyl/3-hydroxydecanoyl-(acyl carrier protein) dehydratase